MRATAAALGTALALAPIHAAPAERPWLEIRSPHFVVLSNGSDKEARRIAWQLEQVRAVFQKLWPWAKPPSGRPFVTFAARNEATLRSLAPAYWEGKGFRPEAVWVMGADKDYVALNLDADKPDRVEVNPHKTLYEAYIFVILRASVSPPLPLWLSNGLQELFGNTVVRDKDVLLGTPIPWHFQTLAQGGQLPLATLFSVAPGSPYYTQETERRRFDANCWALAHYMVLGGQGRNGPQLDRLIGLLSRGSDLASALQQTFGGEAALQEGYRAYIQQPLLAYSKLDIDVDVRPDGFAARALSASQAMAAQGALHVAMRRPGEARSLIEAMRKSNPKEAEASELEGQLADSEGDEGGARAAYARALGEGSASSHAHYRYALLTWRGEAGKQALPRVREALARSVELNADYSWAHAALADALVELGQPEPALLAARQAAALAPAVSSHRVTLARALARGGQPEEALREAGIALTLAASDAERQAARRLLDFLQRPR